jgi:uncharacterized oxidoreductase
MNIINNTILITGGATGIGFALAEHFINSGNNVIICGRRKEKLEEAKARLPKLHTIISDVSIDSARVKLISDVIRDFPDFNVLVNNAGIQQLMFLKKENPGEPIINEIETNLTAPIHLTNLVVHHFLLKKEAAIINISSGLGFIPMAITPVYCATKAAIHSFCISSRSQLRDTSIKVFEIIPPIVETELGKNNSRKERVVKGISADEVAVESLKALQSDVFEFPVGMAVNLYNAAHSDKEMEAFKRMNEQ